MTSTITPQPTAETSTYTRDQVREAAESAAAMIFENAGRLSEDASEAIDEMETAILDALPDGLDAFTRDQVSGAVNAAADSLIYSDEAAEAEGVYCVHETAVDAANAMVNVTMGLLDDPSADIDQIIEEAYGEDAETVLGWLA